MNPLLDQLMRVREDMRNQAAESLVFLRRQGWTVYEASGYHFRVPILNEFACSLVKEDRVPDPTEAVCSVATMELKQVTFPKKISVGKGQIKQALRLCNSEHTKGVHVAFHPRHEKEPDWPLPMWPREELRKYVRVHLDEDWSRLAEWKPRTYPTCPRCHGTGKSKIPHWRLSFERGEKFRNCRHCYGEGRVEKVYFKNRFDMIPLRSLRKLVWQSLCGALNVRMMGAAAVMEDLHTVAIRDIYGEGSGYLAAAHLIRTGDVQRSGKTSPEQQLANECPEKLSALYHDGDRLRHYVLPDGDIICVENHPINDLQLESLRAVPSIAQKRVDRERFEEGRRKEQEKVSKVFKTWSVENHE